MNRVLNIQAVFVLAGSTRLTAPVRDKEVGSSSCKLSQLTLNFLLLLLKENKWIFMKSHTQI